MPRKRSDTEWTTAVEAGRRLGITPQSIGVWGARSDSPTRLIGGQREYQWPNFPRWREEQLIATALEGAAQSSDFLEARSRKMAADAAMAELDLSERRDELVSVEAFRETLSKILTNIRAQLLSVPGRYSARIVGVDSLPDAQRHLDAIVRDVMRELRDGEGNDYSATKPAIVRDDTNHMENGR